ncbi:hypothetical protein HID58_042725 [Brassica napus]|uniref:F-box domain-containing protein n=1 Tax=Brassica napus TaxID=3708 RepID=A0ABQ8BEI0_BRANA|nr:hypothetical protein HID58_042725 [Brassica napus]
MICRASSYLFRLSALPEEFQDLVVQGVAKNSFRDLFRLRTTSKMLCTWEPFNAIPQGDDIRTIRKDVEENGWGWGWPPNTTALLTKRDEFMASVLPSYFTCECTRYKRWIKWQDNLCKGRDMCHRCFWTRELGIFSISLVL